MKISIKLLAGIILITPIYLVVLNVMAAPIGVDGGDPSLALINPLKFGTLTELLTEILKILVVFAVPIVVFFIIYAGFKFVTARGSESELEKAKSAFTWAVIGGVIILGAQLIITVIQGTVDSLK